LDNVDLYPACLLADHCRYRDSVYRHHQYNDGQNYSGSERFSSVQRGVLIDRSIRIFPSLDVKVNTSRMRCARFK
jgi:hypothetical protein